jgi:hypothetical protein
MRAEEENLRAIRGFDTEVERVGEVERDGRVLDNKVAPLEEPLSAKRIVRGVDNQNSARGFTLLT